MNAKRTLRPWIAAMLTGMLGTTAAHTAGATGPAPAESPVFRKTDTNRDGYISRDEARKLANFERAFREADDNRDGKLDAGEFIKAQAIHDRMRAEQLLDDSVITARIKSALVKDLRLKGLEVNVETHEGTVMLSGFVKHRAQARRAAEIAAGVEGVASVRNSLVVKS